MNSLNYVGNGPDEWIIYQENYSDVVDRKLVARVVAQEQAEFIVRAVNSHEELLTAVKVALEFLDFQNHPRNLQEQIAFREHQREVFKKAIVNAEGKP